MLNRDRLKQQDKLSLLNTISLRLIPVIAERVDYDGLIHITEEQIKSMGYMTPKLVPAAIKGLVDNGWISKGENGQLYSLFTCNTTPENKSFYYINLYKLFRKATFKSMYKRRINLMYYFLTSKIPGTWHSIAVERLYKNKTLSQKLAIKAFDDFEDLMSNLIPLIEDGIIEVKLGRQKTMLTKKANEIKEQIYAFCGKDNSSCRKKRIRGEKDTHIFHIRIADEVLKEKTTIFDIERRSTLKDLETIAGEYDYSLDLFDQKSLEEVHMVKHKIHKEFGNRGIAIYRESIKAFFKESSHSFARLMNDKEFGKVIKQYYVIPRIKEELLNFFSTSEKNLNLPRTEAFLRYFSDESYPDDVVVLDHQLTIAYSTQYNATKTKHVMWNNFATKVASIYKKEEVAGLQPKEVLELALKGELTSKKHNKPTNKLVEGATNSNQKSLHKKSAAVDPFDITKQREHLLEKGILQPGKRHKVDYDF